MQIIIPEYVLKILNRLEEAGEAAYIVGGSLRDSLLGNAPHDYDVATSALPEKTKSLFPDMHVIETGIKHGTVTVVSSGNPIEVTTFRIDGSYLDSRHPEEVLFTDKISEDLSRRDFTINAMAYSHIRGFADCFDGKGDLEKRIIRAVRDPLERFDEDALRILRAFRFSSQLGFEIEANTLSACTARKGGIASLSAERICSELLKLLEADFPKKPLTQMHEAGIFPYIFGEYIPSQKLIELIPNMQKNGAARLGFLLAEADEETARAILNRLKCSGKQKSTALSTRRGAHLSINDRADVGRLCASAGVYSEFALRASILLEHSPADAELWLAENRAPSSIADLEISGRDITALGATGALIGKTLTALLDAAIEDPDLNTRERLLTLAEKIIKEKS